MTPHRVFIVGHEGTTGLRIHERLSNRKDIELLATADEDRKNVEAIKVVAKKIKENQKTGKEYTIIACAEGAISEEDSLLSKKKYKAKVASRQGRSVAYEIAEQLQELIPNEVRVALAGHIQRGGNPCSYDRFMATRFGVYGANLLLNKDFGKLVVFDKNEIKAIPLSETAGKLKFVDPECEVVSSAKKMGITFGE